MLLKVVIAEDDDYFRNKLIDEISDFKDIEIAYSTNNGEKLIDITKKIKPQIIITDIDMPYKSGIEAIKSIRKDIPNTDVIFVTSYNEYMKDAIDLYACDFIEKPINIERLRETIDRIKKRYISIDKLICFKLEDSIEFVRPNDLYFVEAMGRKSRVYTTSGSFISSYSMKEVSEILIDKIFYKCSRSNIINLTKVLRIKIYSRYCYEINFINNNEVAYLSKANYEEFLDRLQRVCK